MARLIETIEVAEKHRPCWYISDGEMYRAMFHRWVEERELVAASPFEGGHPAGCIAATFALIETENGTMRMVRPDKIRFADHEAFDSCAWEEPHETAQ